MKLKGIISLLFFILLSFQANAQVEVELADLSGLTYCSFKESKKGNYRYCSDKIKNIFINVTFSKEIFIEPAARSISIEYIYKYISNYYIKLDSEVEELKYDVKFMPSGEWELKKEKNYLYVHTKFFPLKGNKIICVLLFVRNGVYAMDSFLIDISKGDADSVFKKELEKIDRKLGYELISIKGM